MKCYNPATKELIGKSAFTPPGQFIDTIKYAKTMRGCWASSSIKTRIEYISKVRDYIVQNAEEIAEVISMDNGKTRVDAMSAEVFPAVTAISYYMKHAKKFLKSKFVMPGSILLANKLSKIERVPYGVVGIISPWNYPFSIPMSEVVMAILAGNVVILKAATQTQMVGRKIEECFSGLPRGVFSYVNTPGKVAGDILLENNIDKLFFTGSEKVGKSLMKKASETLTPHVLELGGNDAMLVCEDANVYRAASGAVWAGLSNCGQSCGGVERIYVHRNVYAEFLTILSKKVESLRVGQDRNFNVDLGVMTTASQIETVDKHIKDATSKGAVVFAQSGYGRDNNTIPARVLTGVNHDMAIMKEETFGPVLCVMAVEYMGQAVKLANDSDLGLSASVWSKSGKNAKELASQLEVGTVTINDHLMSHGLAETPWGGFKSSGIGRSHGKIGFDEMTQPRVIVNDVLPFVKQNMWWHPHDKKIFDGLHGAIKVLCEKSLVQRVKGVAPLLKIVPRYFIKNKEPKVKLKGKVVLITGAGSGIGRLMAINFAKAGCDVALWDINKNALIDVAHEISSTGRDAFTYVCDVSDKDFVYRVAERVKRDMGKVDILVNNAGVVSGKPFIECSDAEIKKTMDVNIMAHFWTTKAFLPDMIKDNSGHLVTIASSAGWIGVNSLADYCASKFAAVGFDEAIRMELRKNKIDGVKTTAVCPFYINTGMFKGAKSRFGFLLPILDENYVAEKVVKAVINKRAVLKMPLLTYSVPLLRFLPAKYFDMVADILGVSSSMDDFVGRKK